jgi:hypothetical protein
MYSSTQWILITVVVMIAFIPNDVNINNSFVCHGFTTTHRQQSFRSKTSTTVTLMVQHNQEQQPSSLNSDIHYRKNKNDGDRWIMDTTTSSCAAVPTSSRRDLVAKMMTTIMMTTTTTIIMYSNSAALPALASGGATAGRYTYVLLGACSFWIVPVQGSRRSTKTNSHLHDLLHFTFL